MTQTKRNRTYLAERCSKKTGWRLYNLNELQIEEEIAMQIRKAQSRFVQRFGQLRIHAVTYGKGLGLGKGVAYCAYDRTIQRITFFIPHKVGAYMELKKAEGKRPPTRPTVPHAAVPKSPDTIKQRVANQIQFVGRQIHQYMSDHDMTDEDSKSVLLGMRNRYAQLCDELTDLIGESEQQALFL